MAMNRTPVPADKAPQATDVAMFPSNVRSRRGFIGAAGSVGVFLAVNARTALGQTSCLSPSAAVSGNLSNQADAPVCSLGIAPADWKLQTTLATASWSAAGATSPDFKSNVSLMDVDSTFAYKTSQDISNPDSVLNKPGTLVADVLSNTGITKQTGIWEFLAFPNKFPTLANSELIRHLLAARFNAEMHSDYPIKPSQIDEMWNALRTGGRYCPSTLTCSDTMGMSALDVIDYIKGTFATTECSLRYTCKKA